MPLKTRPSTDNQADYDGRFEDIRAQEEFQNIVAQNKDLNDAIDNKYNQGHGAYQPGELSDEEAQAGATTIGASQDESNDPTDTVREAENTPSTTANWADNVKGGTSAKQPFTIKTIGKKLKTKQAAAVGSIGGLIAIAMISLSLLLSPSMFLVHIKEVIYDRFNIQNTTIDARTHKILVNKLSKTIVKGCAGPITVTCKFNKMSNRMLKSLADQGIVAYGKDGKPLDVSDGSKFAAQRPEEFRPTGDTAKSFGIKEGEGIKAKDYPDFLDKNPAAMGMHRRAINPRWEAFWDTTMVKFFNKIGFGGRNAKITGDDDKSVKDSVKEDTDKINEGKQPGAADPYKDETKDKNGKPQSTDNPESVNDANDINAGRDAAGAGGDFKEISSKMAKKTSGPMAVVGAACMVVSDGAKIGKAVRALQVAQLAAYAAMFYQVADEIKTSNQFTPASAAKISTIGLMFMQSQKDSSGKFVKKSAAESDGVLYALEGNKSFSSPTSDINNWIPGGGWMGNAMKVISAIRSGGNGAVIDKACDAYNSPAGQVLQFALAPGWGAAIGLVAGMIAAPLIQHAMESFLKAMAGSLVHSTDLMEDLGNAFSVGGILLLGESGNAGATMPMTPNQAVAYNEQTKQDQLANAAVDRATLSPFDMSSPNTFMGSIFTKMMPYYGAISSGPFGTMGAITNVVSSTFSSMFTQKASAYATLSPDEYANACKDKTISAEGIAADYVCNVQYGIPVNYLNDIDPEENVQWLIDNKMVKDEGAGGGYEDDDSIITHFDDGKETPLYTYLTKCRQNPDTTLTSDCIIDSEEKARYALYYIDHRIQKNMDGEDEYTSNASLTASSSSNSSSATAGSGAAIGDYKPGSYQCAEWVGQLVLPDIYGIPNPGGNGNEIAPRLGSAGYKVDSTPAVHAVVSWPASCNCQGGSSSAGHVGIVDAVNADGSIVVEAYNSHGDEKYAVTTITAANAKKLMYAHVESKFGTGPVKIGVST